MFRFDGRTHQFVQNKREPILVDGSMGDTGLGFPPLSSAYCRCACNHFPSRVLLGQAPSPIHYDLFWFFRKKVENHQTSIIV